MSVVRQIVVVLAVAAALIAGAFAGGTAAQRGNTVVVGMAQEPDLIGPFSSLAATAAIENSLYADMVIYDDQWKLTPVVVEKIPTVKDGDWVVLPGKKMKVTWKFKKGFTWHDGRGVTALDARFTYGMLRHPDTPTISRFILRKIDNMLVPDPVVPYTLVVQWNELYAFANTGHELLPRHLLEAAFLRDPSKMKTHPYWRAPVGNGAYTFKEWVPGSHFALEAYEQYPQGAPRIKTQVWRFILDSTVLVANNIAGQVDVTEINNFSCDQIAEVERRNAQVAGHYTPSLTMEYMNFNLDNEWLRDRRVRYAIAHALDRQAISNVACAGGRQPVAHTWVPQRHEAFNPNVKRYAFDPARARQLLAEAGWLPGPDGVLVNAKGERFVLNHMTTAGSAIRELIQQVMKEQLKAVGIELRIDNRPASVLFGTIMRRRQFPHMTMSAFVFSPVTVPFPLFHSTQIPTPQNNFEGQNRAGWVNPENDRISDQINEELDTQKRIQLFRRQQDLFADDLPMLPLYFRLSLTTAKKAIKNVKPAGLSGTYITWNSHEWAWEH